VNVLQSGLAGYARIIERYELVVPVLLHSSVIGDISQRKSVSIGKMVEETFPAKYWPGDGDFDHLVFALKYDGADLFVLQRIFAKLDRAELVRRIASQPTSKYARRIFFLFELLTGEHLELGDLTKGAYVPALDPTEYFVSTGRRSTRHRVTDNLLGDAGFCPVVRRTVALEDASSKDLGERARRITSDIDPALLARAIAWLYTKETKSSFAIEREDPGDRTERFVAQLAAIGNRSLDDEAALTSIQKSFTDPRFVEQGFRKADDPEVYVGETIGFSEKIHHVGARSVSTPDLMAAWKRMRAVEGKGGAVIEAACRSFSFVFIHPFGDGNGRIHRLLLHNVLARRGFLPSNLVVPISAVIHQDPAGYDRTLESFSARILPLIRYSLDDDGELTINNDTDALYRYPDLTVVCEATFNWLERAIEVDLVAELAFLRLFDEARARMREIVEMPDKKEQLFIKLILRNGGRLSSHKRRLFAQLDDATIAALEAVVTDAMGSRRS
jgi:hypothetical protein